MKVIGAVVTPEAGYQKECCNAGYQCEEDCNPQVNRSSLQIGGPIWAFKNYEQIELPRGNCADDR